MTLTNLRSISAAENLTFFVNVFKLLANSTYGKFAQNPNNFTHAKLCLNEKELRKATNSNRFLSVSVINQNVAIVEYKPEKVLYDSPFPVAATILDLAKLHLYYYYYLLKPAFLPDNVSLLMSDIDSIIFSVNCINFFGKYKNYQCLTLVIFQKIIYCILMKIEKLSFFSKMKIP